MTIAVNCEFKCSATKEEKMCGGKNTRVLYAIKDPKASRRIRASRSLAHFLYQLQESKPIINIRGHKNSTKET